MNKVGETLNCGAYIKSPGYDTRICVLAAGHYMEMAEYIDAGWVCKSWHTDCPNVPGLNRPLTEHDHEHPGKAPFMCLTWADHAEGAHPSGVVSVTPDPEPANPLFDVSPAEYTAHLVIGAASLRVKGPHRMVANAVRAMADAFEEEAER